LGVLLHLWAKKHHYWPEIRCIGSITGCGLTDFKDRQKKPLPGANRLYRIIILEATHLIWKLRNECIFKHASEDQWPSARKIHNRWLTTINARLTLDRSSTSSKYGSRAIKSYVVLDTWSNTLRNEIDLLVNWIKSPRVLVDIAPSKRQRGPDLPDDPP
jgi:ribonuclease HI